LSGCLSGFTAYLTRINPVVSMAYARFVGFVGFDKEERGLEKLGNQIQGLAALARINCIHGNRLRRARLGLPLGQ
jgi:hypothetical protein